MWKSMLSIAILIFPPWISGQENLRGDYLGQKPPGMIPAIFAPGVISTDSIEHSSPAFSPEGNLVLWSPVKRNAYPNSFLLEMRREDGKWKGPTRPSFADSSNDDIYPVFSSDGTTLFFSSRRALPSGGQSRLSSEGLRIWVVERKGDSWGIPAPLDTSVSFGQEYAHSTSENGTLYFSSNRPGGKGSLDLYRSLFVHGKYQPPEPLGNEINTSGYEDGPLIAPDESYLIFESSRAGGIEGSIDLYICYRRGDGSWSPPRNLGSEINSKYSERFARFSPDGRYFFFGSTRRGLYDVYWIDATTISKQADPGD